MSPLSNTPVLSNEILDNDFIKSIEDSLLIGSWELDIKSNVLKWSSVTKKIHEVEKDYIPNVDTALNFYKEGINRNKIKKLFNDCLTKGRSVDNEFIIVTAKGNEKWVRAIGHAIIKNGECVLLKGIFQDITKKTLDIKKVLLREEQFSSIFNNSLTGIAILSLTGDWLKVNNSICNILGYTEEEFLKLSFRDVTHQDDLEIGRKEIILMLSNRMNSFQVEKRYIHKKGNSIYCILTCSIVRDFKGDPKHFIANINNISKMKIAEDKIKNLLNISSKQNDRLQNFAHIVSHNLRSHGGNLEMLLKLKKDEYPETINNEYFPLIEKAVNTLNETIHNLNEVAIHNSVDAKDLKLLNLLYYTNNAIDNIKALIIANKAKIEVLISNDINVIAIPAYLDSILINLLTNAVKFKRPNIDSKIKLEAKQEDNNIVFSVIDNGLGIDLKRHREKLFGMYNVFHEHKKSRGLGLFITKNQVDSIGGKIEVESDLGQGSKFKIYFKI